MKMIKRFNAIYNNVKALMLTDDVIIGQRDVQNMMSDQLGAGWIDRIMAVRGRLKPEQVESVITEASSRASGKLGDLFELMYYIESDPRLGGMLQKRTSAASRVIWNVTSGNTDNPDAADAAMFVERYVNDIRFKSFLESAMDGLKFGVTGFHNVIIDAGDKYVFQDPTENQISQSRWWQERSNDPNWGRLYLKSKTGDKLFLHRDTDIHPAQLSVFISKHKRGYFDTTGFMNRVLRLYVLKVWTLVFLAQYVERYGKPFIYTKLSEDKFDDPQFKAKVASALRNFGSERWGIFPDGFSVDSLTAAQGSSTDLHMRVLDYVNTEMAISVLGQNLSTEVKGGSFAAATSHFKVEGAVTRDDVEWLEEQINDHFLFWLLRLNWPNMDRHDFPKIRLEPVRDVDVEKVARGYKSLSELVDVPEEEIRSKAQSRMPKLKPNADELVGADRYAEPVIGPSNNNRARNADDIIRRLGGT